MTPYGKNLGYGANSDIMRSINGSIGHRFNIGYVKNGQLAYFAQVAFSPRSLFSLINREGLVIVSITDAETGTLYTKEELPEFVWYEGEPLEKMKKRS